jgi:hypothetical protein
MLKEIDKKQGAKMEKYINLLEQFWDSELDIEIEEGDKILIFKSDGYWDYEGNWHPSEERWVEEPDLIYFPQFEEFSEMIEREGVYDMSYTLEEAKELVKKYFGE